MGQGAGNQGFPIRATADSVSLSTAIGGPGRDASQPSLYVEGQTSQALALAGEQQRELGPRCGVPNILVEMRGETTVLRKFTDPEGEFEFTDLRPGIWTLKVYDTGLPPNHVLEQADYQLVLRPEDVIEMNLRVIPRLRTIQILEETNLSTGK